MRNLTQKLSILLLFLSLGCQDDSFVASQQDEISQSKPSFKVSTIFKQDIQSNEQLTKKMTNLEVFKYNQVGKIVYNETYDFTINTNVAKLIENTNDNGHSYTFAIDRENDTDSDIENLVFSYDESSDNYNAGLVTYHLTATQKQEYLDYSQITTPFNISFSSLDIDIDDILNKNGTPCTVTYQEFHNPHNSQNTHLHTSNGEVINECENDGPEDEPCSTSIVIIIDCPDGGSAPNSPHDTSTPDPNNNTNNTNHSTAGTTGNSNADTTTNTTTNNNVVTSLMTVEESLIQSILDCINASTSLSSTDMTTIDPEILNQINMTLSELDTINDFLLENNCNEEAQIIVLGFFEIRQDTPEMSFDLYQDILEFEQDYRGQMSEEELSIFDTLTTKQQLKYLWSAYEAVQLANHVYSNPCELHNGKGDALRHAYWNALATRRIGAALTHQLTTAHENRPVSYVYSEKEKQMDLHNNQIGRNMGQLDVNVLEQAIFEALNNGDLLYLNNLNSNCFATFTSQLIPTNQ